MKLGIEHILFRAMIGHKTEPRAADEVAACGIQVSGLGFRVQGGARAETLRYTLRYRQLPESTRPRCGGSSYGCLCARKQVSKGGVELVFDT